MATVRSTFSLLCGLFVAGCVFASGGIRGSGVAATESRELKPFSKIRLEGGYVALVEVSDKSNLQITADDNLLPIIETIVEGDTLVVRSSQSMSTKTQVRLNIATPSLSRLQIDGSGDVTIDKVAVPSLTVSINGSGKVVASGSAEKVTIAIAGAGSVDTLKVAANEVDVNISGSGKVRVDAARTLDASISGSGDIRFTGDPKITQKVDGSGTILKM